MSKPTNQSLQDLDNILLQFFVKLSTVTEANADDPIFAQTKQEILKLIESVVPERHVGEPLDNDPYSHTGYWGGYNLAIHDMETRIKALGGDSE